MYKIPMIVISVLTLGGCVGLNINGTDLSPQGIIYSAAQSAAKGVIRSARATQASGRAERLSAILASNQVEIGQRISPQVLALIEEDYQKVVDDVFNRIQRIQKDASAQSQLNQKGPMRRPKLVIVNAIESDINATSLDDVVEPKIFLTTSLIVRSLYRLQAEQKELSNDVEGTLLQVFSGYTRYVPYLEFEEAMRLVISHESAHIWLHTPGMDVRSREIEADAWGVALSSSLSEVFQFRTKAGAMVLGGGFETHDEFDMALMSSRFGFDVLDDLYGEEGVLAQSPDRQSLAERRKSVKEKYDEIFSRDFDALKTRDVFLFGLMRKLL